MPRQMIYQTEEERKKARNKQHNNYLKSTTTIVTLKFFNTTDASVIAKIQSVDNRTDYIRQLILKDIEENA